MKFEVYKSAKDSQWRFRMIARNGKNIGMSEGYKRRSDCTRTISSIKATAVLADVVVLDPSPPKPAPKPAPGRAKGKKAAGSKAAPKKK